MSGVRKMFMLCRSSWKHGDINVQCRMFRSSSSHSGARIRFLYLVREMNVIAECELEWQRLLLCNFCWKVKAGRPYYHCMGVLGLFLVAWLLRAQDLAFWRRKGRLWGGKKREGQVSFIYLTPQAQRGKTKFFSTSMLRLPIRHRAHEWSGNCFHIVRFVRKFYRSMFGVCFLFRKKWVSQTWVRFGCGFGATRELMEWIYVLQIAHLVSEWWLCALDPRHILHFHGLLWTSGKNWQTQTWGIESVFLKTGEKHVRFRRRGFLCGLRFWIWFCSNVVGLGSDEKHGRIASVFAEKQRKT